MTDINTNCLGYWNSQFPVGSYIKHNGEELYVIPIDEEYLDSMGRFDAHYEGIGRDSERFYVACKSVSNDDLREHNVNHIQGL